MAMTRKFTVFDLSNGGFLDENGNNNKEIDETTESRKDYDLLNGAVFTEETAKAAGIDLSEDKYLQVPITQAVVDELPIDLKDTAPVYYALGNHELDYMENGHPDLIEELENAGAVVLDKNYVDIEINETKVRLGGLYDYAFGLNDNNDAMSAPADIRSFLQDFQNTDSLKIMLSHRPDSFIFGDASKVWDVDLVVSGHNHGGQVVIPFLGGLYGGDQGWFPEYVHGMYQKDNLLLFETSGLGSDKQKLPRFNNPPEVAVLTIR